MLRPRIQQKEGGMTQLTLIGVDPGIMDTGIVSIKLDTLRKTLMVTTQVWSEVTSQKNQSITIDPDFLDELESFYEHEASENAATFAFVEGYRQRGKNIRQDANMLALVQACNHAMKGSKIVDNTGIKKVVTEPLLRLFGCSRFQGTHHADLKSAARVALKGGIEVPPLNKLLTDYVLENLKGEKWSPVSYQTL